MRLILPLPLVIALSLASSSWATDVPVTGLKLIVVDKTVLASKAKAVFVAKDADVTKGAGTDPAQIGATLDIAYDSVSGTFDMPAGANWLVNSGSVGKYVNKTAPTGGAVKVSVVKPGSLVKVVGKSLGDVPLDISSAPTGNVYVVDTIVNGGDTTRLCTQFAGCVHKLIAGDTGYKLICKGNGSGDPACTAVPPPTVCTPGSTAPCYSGPQGTEGVGICSAGIQTCNAFGTGYSACVGEVTPGTEVCGNGLDDNCDGMTDEGC